MTNSEVNKEDSISQETSNEQSVSTSAWKIQIKEIFKSWKFKLAIILTVIMSLISVVFFWHHLMAVTGLKMWASHADAQPIDCMMKDSDNNEYISCTAKMNDQVVPLECGVSFFNLGCRVNYGASKIISKEINGR